MTTAEPDRGVVVGLQWSGGLWGDGDERLPQSISPGFFLLCVKATSAETGRE